MRSSYVSFVIAFTCSACVACHHPPPQAEDEADLEGKVDAMRVAVTKHVSDAGRAARVNEAVDGVEVQLLSIQKLVTSFHSEALALNARPDATRADFVTLVQQIDKQRLDARTNLINLHLKMTANTTADEWKELAGYERAIFSTAWGR